MHRTLLFLLPLLLCMPAAPAAAHDGLHEQIAALDVLIEKSPDSVTLRVRRADLHRRHRDWDLAVSDLEAARTLSPAWPGIDLVQGRVWLDMGWARSAEACATRYLAAQPKSESGLLLRAKVLSALERWDAATQAFADLVAESDAPQPDHYLAWSRAERRGTGDRRAEALAVLDAGIDRLGPAPALHLEAIDLEIGTERFDAALERVDALASNAKRQERWLSLRGDVLVAAKRTDAARDAYSSALAAIDGLTAKQRSTRATGALREHVVAALATLKRP